MKLGNNKKNLFLSFSGFCEGGWNCLKYFKWVGKEKRGGEAKIFKKKGQVGSRDDALKKRGAGIPLRYYDVSIHIVAGFFIYFYLLFISH